MSEATDQQKRIVAAFLKMTGECGCVPAEKQAVIAGILKESFGIDDAAKFECAEKLEDIWAKGAPAASPAAVEVDEKKWQEFIDVLKQKGYFKDCEDGSDEYKSRMQKARAKFIARSNPYEGMTPDQLKAKGNELMTKGQHKSAVGYYCKAIELEPEKAIYYANRAAAYTHLNQFNDAVRDCEAATRLDPGYAKAYSRLGTAYFYLNKYTEAAEAYKKACDIDPENEAYKADLAAAEQKKAEPPRMGGMPGGMPDFSAMGKMMENPQFMQMAQNLMANPQFSQMVQNMATSMGMPQMGGMDPQQMVGEMEPDADGMVQTPFGAVHKDALERIRSDPSVRDNPKMKEIQEEIQREGPAAIMKHMNDPEVMKAMSEFSQLFGGASPGGGNPPDSAAGQ
eukprot:TRINITY_DN6051_c0_g2_i1.p1 TRINITY_DN6051_c0_g2~~TRINITY_DN6051_c0_g2_i1.p1  ORF type:complete len:396 (+),score=178.60 TRINITY_DN6051_c0_g2_i1:91-1278(+)